MNNAKKLPDAYKKQIGSNLYNVLQLANLLDSDYKSDLQSIAESRNLHSAYGKTLDNYGAMFGVDRQSATDEQYRTKILNQIALYTANSDVNSLVNSISLMLDTEKTELTINEWDLLIRVGGLTMAMLENTGYKSNEISSMIKRLLPVGVKLMPPQYEGTLHLFQYNKFPWASSPTYNNAPTLFSAWVIGQEELQAGNDIGLSGYGEVPTNWGNFFVTKGYQTSGTYEGGTLGILSGEDE